MVIAVLERPFDEELAAVRPASGKQDDR